MAMDLLKNIAVVGLGISGIAFGYIKPQFFQREIPVELDGVKVAKSLKNGSVLESFRSNQLQFKPIRDGKIDLQMVGARPLAFSGMPKVPQLLRVFNVDSTQEAEVYLENVVLEETTVSVPIAKSAEAYVWDLKKRLTFREETSERYFPGKLVQSHQSKGSLFVNLFPVQVDLLTGRVLKVTSADIKVEYSKKTLSLAWSELFSSPSLIVTSAKLQSAAEVLKNYHEQKLGVKTSIITVEEIEKNTSPISEQDLPPGYKEPEERDNFIKPYDPAKGSGYNYELAKKIVNYLQKKMGDSSPLKYVTILGDAETVPPSYYFAYSTNLGRNFTPTDICYGATQHCLEPKIAVGRLPLKDENEVKSYIKKVEAWRAFSENNFGELTLLGGKAFPNSDVYVGELGVLNTIQDNKLDWLGVRKNFKTQKNYSKEKLMEVAKGQSSSPFAYHLDHGTGNQWFAENEYVSSKEIAAINNTSDSLHPTIMVSVSCTNGAFDEALTNESIYDDDSYGELSIGTQLIRSKAGVAAYLGSARPAIGMPVYQIDGSGNLELTGTNYGLQILDSFYQKYGLLRQGRLGDFSLKALQAFVFEYGNDIQKDQNSWSYFITELLGDPVIPLPNRLKGADSFQPGKSILKLDNSSGFGFPVLHSKDFVQNNFPLSLVQTVSATLMKVLKNDFGGYLGEDLITSQIVQPGKDSQFTWDSQKTKLTEGTYFLRLENIVGVPRERQIYFVVD